MHNDDNVLSVHCTIDGVLARTAKHCTPSQYVATEIDVWLHVLHEEMKRVGFEPAEYIVSVTVRKS